MKTIYLDCAMGAAGDMLLGALYELLPDREGFLSRLEALGLPGVEFLPEPSKKCGILGTHMRVLVHGHEEGHDHPHTHSHTGLAELTHQIGHMALPEAVRGDILAVFRSIADAESRVHGVPVEEIHFHEVGSLDALADVTGVCLAMSLLAPEQVVCSPVHVGSGQVRCAHGILPVPAPATALLLEGIPIYGGQVAGELCTPTGAALLRHFVSAFAPLPLMRVERTGYGMGTRDFEAANCVRALLGSTDAGAEQVVELACNLDDMTPEAIGFAMERLLEAGALDVYTTPIGMKKCRPGVLLTVLCREEDRRALTEQLFRHTTTLGVRLSVHERDTLSRRSVTVQTPDGPVRVKESTGWGVTRRKPEYDDLAELAQKTGKSLAELTAAIQ